MVSQKQKSSSHWQLLGPLFSSTGIALEIHHLRVMWLRVLDPGAVLSGALEFPFLASRLSIPHLCTEMTFPIPWGHTMAECNQLSHLGLELPVMSRCLTLFICGISLI